MYYFITVNVILILFFLSFFYLIFQWLKLNINIKELFPVVLFAIVITFVFKFPFSNHFFGLEYEDSYVYNFSGRQLYEGIYPSSFLTDGINIGSLSKPISTITYGGHFITYSVLISWAYKIFGYNMYIPSYLNSLINFLIILTLSLSFKTVFSSAKKYWYIPGVVYSLSPAMNVFANTHLSETFSSFVVLITILSFFYYFQSSKKIFLLIFSISFLTSILTKRENTVLLSFFIIFSIFQIVVLRKNWISSLSPVLICLIVLIIYMSLIQNVFLIEKTESAELSTFTFSLSYFFKLASNIVKALVNFKWFGIYFFLLVSATLFLIFNLKKYPIHLSLITLYIIYFLIYSFHYRSYYFVHFNEVKPFEALRYLNNFFIISSLIISLCLSELLLLPIGFKPIISLLTILLLISVPYTYLLRKHFAEIEKEDRFTNPTLVLEYLSKKDDPLLITDNILIFQLLGDRNLEVIDLANIEVVPSEYKYRNTYLFITSFNKTNYFQHRFSSIYEKFQTTEKREIIEFGNNDSFYKIE